MLQEFFQAFLAIFVIMDVIGVIPIYWSLSRKLKKKERAYSIDKAITIASIILFLFLFLGDHILSFFRISIHSFKVAGGIILAIVGIQRVLGIRFKEEKVQKYEFAIVPLSTPLITGPGVITTVMILTAKFGIMIALLASLLNLTIAWLSLRFSDKLYKVFGRQGADVMSRIMGLILVAISVELIKFGWNGIN
jgi:multiple antibiotic resistance protein